MAMIGELTLEHSIDVSGGKTPRKTKCTTRQLTSPTRPKLSNMQPTPYLSFMRGSGRFCGKFRRFFPFPAFFAAALIANNLGSGSRANFGDHSLSLLITIVPIKGYQMDLRN